MKDRLYEKIGHAYVLRELLSRAIMADGDIWHESHEALRAYSAVAKYLEGLVRDAIDFGIERGDFAMPEFKLDALNEEFTRAVYRITRIEAQKPPTFGDVIRAKWLAWKRRIVTG